MPINGIGSWLPVVDEFLQHWSDVNAALAPSELTLLGSYNRASLVTDRTALETAINAVPGKLNLLQTARGDRDIKRASVRARMLQFGPAVRGFLPNTRYIRSIPLTPGFRDAPGKWREAMQDMKDLWTTININVPPISGFTPPLVLSGSYSVLLFTGDQTSLNTAFTTVGTNEQAFEQSLEVRDATFAPIYERLKQYRQAVLATFPANSPLVLSLPKLTPAAGHTPKAVIVSAIWDVGEEKARISYTASDDPQLQEYELRGCLGSTKWKDDEAVVLGNNPPGVLEFLTDDGMVASGSHVWYKVYVRLTTGNEKGSRAVKVTRP